MYVKVYFFAKKVYKMILWASGGGKIKKNKCKFTCFFLGIRPNFVTDSCNCDDFLPLT